MSDESRVKASISVRFDEAAGETALQLELDHEKNAGVTEFAPGAQVYIRAVSDRAIAVRSATRGSVKIDKAGLFFEHEEHICFGDSDCAWLSYPAAAVLRAEWIGKGLGQVTISDKDVRAAEKGYGILKVKYRVAYTRLILSGVDAEGPVLVWAEDEAGRKGDLEVSFSAHEEEPLVVVVRDICTGMPVAGANVEIDGRFIGQTDAYGRLSAGAVSKGLPHSIRTTAPGYKDSDYDALANDQFVLE